MFTIIKRGLSAAREFFMSGPDTNAQAPQKTVTQHLALLSAAHEIVQEARDALGKAITEAEADGLKIERAATGEICAIWHRLF